MALLLPLLAALVLCSCGPVGSLGCDLPQNSALLSRKTLELLGQMRRVSPFSCLKDRRDFRFPQRMVDGSQLQGAQAASVLHELLQQIFNLFNTEGSSAAWKAALLQELLPGLHQQLEQLEQLDTCLVQGSAQEESGLGAEQVQVALKKYFRGLHLYLEEKKHSACAWEIVRVEIVRALSSAAQLGERLSEDAGLGSS